MAEYSVDEILRGIRSNNDIILAHIYRSFFQQIKFYVNNNNGTTEDAQDVYQEALIVIYRKLITEDLKINNCSFNTYLYSVCKLLWLKQLEKKRIKIDEYAENEEIIDMDDDIIEVYERSDRFKLFQKHFKSLQKDCQRVLTLSLEKTSLKDISKIMGYKSEKYAKKRKYQCKERLINQIKKDPKYNELKQWTSSP